MKLAHEVALAIHGFYDGGEIHLPSPIEVFGAGVIRPGWAMDQIQVCSSSTKETAVLLQSFAKLNEFLYERSLGVPIYRVNRHANKTRVLRESRWWHPHTQSLVKPLYAPDEFAGEAGQLIRMADLGFTTIDFDVTKYRPEAQLLRLNLLNLVGPAVLAHLHSKQYLLSRQDKRHELWRYAERKERVPLGWSWQRDVASYLREVVPLTKIFAYTAERAEEQYVFPDGLFHYATLVASEGKTLIRFSALPALSPRQAVHFVEVIDRWLARAVKVVGSTCPATAEEAARTVRFYNRRPIPASPSVRLYLSER